MPTITTTPASEIIADAYLFGGIGDQYNALDAVTVNTGMRFLNALSDMWSTEEDTIFDIVEGTFNMPNSPPTNSVLVGPGNSLNVRPAYVEQVAIVDAQNVTHRVDVIGVDEWAKIPYKPAVGRPEVYYNDQNVPSETWYFWPTPAFAGDVCHAWYWNTLQQFSQLTDTLAAPPGYVWFLKTNLALALMATLNKEPTALQKEMAGQAYNDVKRSNKQPKVLETDLPMQYVRTFNIFTGI